ncbi:MAG: tRNA uridine-5-carboxymethylaminomethyl(34) synthesis enzyme MnmG, partial [Methylobacteriaceae bacterium]|nr:tRNA uridine-5-carboxymethylaminomethyl(34) synthesis enzyme MnmG [Methylobacteriaceae bacterium]
SVYLQRQSKDIALFRRDEELEINPELDYAAIDGLSNELKTRLALVRPVSIGQAGRVEGMTPAALSLLIGRSRRRGR